MKRLSRALAQLPGRTVSFSAIVFAGVVQFLLAQERDTLELELADLSAALVSDREQVSTANARKLLRRAGDSQSVALTSELKKIAEQEHLDRLISLGAFDALWRLGESDEYFSRFLESQAVSRVQQVNAIWILARNATEQSARKIDAITWHEGDNRTKRPGGQSSLPEPIRYTRLQLDTHR
jgi:hypothetical protein